MPTTWGQFKTDIRARVFPAGEAPNLVNAHDKMFVDAMIDLQSVVECMQQDNTNLFPHCSTFYNCGLTVLDAPRGSIKKVSIIDKGHPLSPANNPQAGAPGSTVADYTFPVKAFFDPVPPPTIIYNVKQAGDYVVEVDQFVGFITFDKPCPPEAQSCAQFIVTTITYTDQSGQLQAVKPAANCLWGTNNTGTLTISCAADSKITATIELSNVPFTDGSYKVRVAVTTTGVTGLNGVVTPDDDFCSEIAYNQIDPCLIHRYLNRSNRAGCCMSIPFFFGLPPVLCGKAMFPIPTDAGLPAGLPILPLGFHYPQTSTNKLMRARAGVWANEKGKIWIAPWINSTETVMVSWEGIKRTFADADPVDDDPLLSEAVECYVRWKHLATFDHDYEAAADAERQYSGGGTEPGAKPKLIHQCREETRVRECEPSFARASTGLGANLFYNDQQTAQATCQSGTTGSPVTVTIPAGTVASSISVSDANVQAKAQAQAQAQAQLVCSPAVATFTNDAQTATVACQGDPSAPPPDGSPQTVTIPAGTVTSTVSKSDANAQALALAESQAADQLSCTFWNASQTFTAKCPNNQAITQTVTVSQHTISSTISQADADAKALNSAKTQANAAISCGGGGPFLNTVQNTQATQQCSIVGSGTGTTGLNCSVTIRVQVKASTVSSLISQADANQQALAFGNQYAAQLAASYCQQRRCGVFPPIPQPAFII